MIRAALPLLLAGCGYGFAVGGPALPSGVGRVYVPVFVNRSVEPDAGALFAEALAASLGQVGRTGDESQIEAWLTAEGDRTRLVVEERGLPVDGLHFYGAGWQVHLEDLGRSLADEGPVHEDCWSSEAPAAAWNARWTELTPSYQGTPAGQGD